ncbi:hypothetical protein U9M48_043126 [Paspalum notatum var. saurae]|uniref:Uncharacterized protein n=1 Tax=Paspalum notatum var. saurae TaxID=547442 RepID=A0AAQ3USU0_PASNO
MHVTGGNGDQVACSSMFPGVKFMVGCAHFVANGYAMPIGGHDMVLGVGFFGELGPILWDFGEHCIDKETPPALNSLTAASDNLLGSLLVKFSNLFREPAGLPPHRSISHHIRLLPGTNAVAVRPYRYAHIQKDELK